MISYDAFLKRVIEDGIEAARRDYAGSEDKHKLEGSIAGFEACRGQSVKELRQLLVEAMEQSHKRYFEEDVNGYWRQRCYALEIEWVCNVVSAMLRNEGLPEIICPTARGTLKAADIIGVKEK